MNQSKTGNFIAQLRKEKGLTQQELGDKLHVTDRAVSKWETGKCLPDTSLMPELCSILGISINELLSGEKIESQDYVDKAEAHLMELAEKNRQLLNLEYVLGTVCSVVFIVLCFVAGYAGISDLLRILLIVMGCVILFIGVFFCMKIEHKVGYFECPNCGACYVPSVKAFVFSPHIMRSRYLKCPYCGKKGYHKKVLTKN